MNKKVSSLVLAGALVLGSVLPVAASAATVTSTNGKTTSEVTFDAPDNVTKPVDPTNPGTTVKEPDGSDNGGATVDPTGPLSFLYVSKDINFGSQKAVTTGTQSFKNTTETPIKVTSQGFGSGTANTNLVTEVSDTRGTNAGWNVQVSSSALTLDGATDVLKGATINFGADDTTKNTVTNSGDAAATGVAGQSVALATGDATGATIYSAAKDAGAGSTAFQLSPDNISITGIEANAKAGTYEGSLTWTLNDTPTN
ncbi:WxL domain-containing protein [Lactiplantibacillus sp. WILCCON 0030]|uniref:WxL domain-containing protein n=1 Tax=Lactiplantibacillus brownii TaxID=3069269 RepID=A0ABU1AAG6_9LACO|nr:WxL domain-containing protein [Lactiplantibacillus brownii]MDQ7937973.1 WxL domain-containing protein [Lactiplantibacillus brownii]